MRVRTFVRYRRRFEDGCVRGYVLDVGPKFVMLAEVGAEVRFDGFICCRIVDVKDLMRDPYAAFAIAALKKFKQRTPKKPAVSVARLEELLITANRAFPLVTIHRQLIKPDVCWMGRVMEVKRGELALLEIGPDAKWDREPSLHKLSDITTVEFGGEYERALHLVGGNPPSR